MMALVYGKCADILYSVGMQHTLLTLLQNKKKLALELRKVEILYIVQLFDAIIVVVFM